MNPKSMAKTLLAAFGLVLLIFDTRTALQGAAAGLSLCLQTLIPSLLPFIFLSTILTNALIGKTSPLFSHLAKTCHMPAGTESLLLVGLLGGYPVGAQNIAVCCSNKQVSKKQAERMLAFCNNAGPAFLFGIVSYSFSKGIYPWLLWIIHILSAIMVGMVYPKQADEHQVILPRTIPISEVMQKTVAAMLTICSWGILFRAVLAFFDRWFLWAFPIAVRVIFSGMLELANGCVQLAHIPAEGIRFVVASILLSWGGFCVAMQTVSVTGGLSCRHYFCGKLLQTLFSLFMSSAVSKVILPGTTLGLSVWANVLLLIIIFAALYFHRLKNRSSIPVRSGV